MMGRTDRQQAVADWCNAAFGARHANDLEHRGLRLVEEAIEAAQSVNCDPEVLHKLIDYVYARPPGTLDQELGGVGVTLLAMANAAGADADKLEQREVDRVLSKPIEHFAKRNREKDEAGFVSKGAKGDSDATT